MDEAIKTTEENRVIKRIKHISHNDLDGYGCTIISKAIFGLYGPMYELDIENIYPPKLLETVQNTIDNIDDYDAVFITDLSINPLVYDLVKEFPDKIMFLDHHELDPSINGDTLARNVIIQKFDNTETDRKTCGTELYYKFLRDNSQAFNLVRDLHREDIMEYFVKCVCSYDTYAFWKHRSLWENGLSEIPETSLHCHVEANRLNTLFHIIDREEFINYIINLLCYIDIKQFNEERPITITTPKPFPQIIFKNSAIDEYDTGFLFSYLINIEEEKSKVYIESSISKMAKSKLTGSIYKHGVVHYMDYDIGVIFAYKNSSMIGSMACERNPDIDICCVVSNNQVSFYSSKVDVGEIALLLNGGGHKEAAGITIPFVDSYNINIDHFIKMINCAGNLEPGSLTTK